MDDKTEPVSADKIDVVLGDHTYRFAKLTEGQALAIILAQELNEGTGVVGIVGDVLRAAAEEGPWREFVKRLAVGEHTSKDFSTLVNALLGGGAGGE